MQGQHHVSGSAEAATPTTAATFAVRLSWEEANRDDEKAVVDNLKTRIVDAEGWRQPSDDVDCLSIPVDTFLGHGAVSANRSTYLTTVPKYAPISALVHWQEWDEFLTAFVTTFCCHAMLWSIDIHHRDIRPHNLMWDSVAREAKLCDFDWCHPTEPQHLDSEAKAVESKCYVNAGAWIFMSSDLLTSPAMAGKVRRVYRHDVEGFLYVFVWLIFRNMGGFLPGWASPIRWNDSDRHLIESERYATFDALMNLDCAGPLSIPAGLWDYIDLTTMSLYFFIRDASSASSDHRTYALYLKKRPGKAAMYKPGESLLVYNGLQALSKIFERPAGIFDHPRTMGLVELLKGYLDSSGSYFSPFCPADFEKEEHCADIEAAQWAPYPTVTTAYEPLSSITTNWDEFLGAFFAIFSCHALLWSAGVRHQDIRPDNLVWDSASRQAKICDFDLGPSPDLPEVADEPGRRRGYSNTGTWTFMASELLTDNAMARKVKRVYRHEVEAYFAVLVWITFRYANGTLRDSAPLDDWKQTAHSTITTRRAATYLRIEDCTIPQPPSLTDALWIRIKWTIIHLLTLLDEVSLARRRQRIFEEYFKGPVETP
ncbi:hypothetical protein NMY22_g753 [Coprinellus aureogranulatus]|nr:hypothetical protein NMY22_g753 [Coprinellus aureogranulatus]